MQYNLANTFVKHLKPLAIITVFLLSIVCSFGNAQYSLQRNTVANSIYKPSVPNEIEILQPNDNSIWYDDTINLQVKTDMEMGTRIEWFARSDTQPTTILASQTYYLPSDIKDFAPITTWRPQDFGLYGDVMLTVKVFNPNGTLSRFAQYIVQVNFRPN